MAKKNQKLTLAQVKKEAKKLHQTEEHELKNGSTITFYPLFPETEIEKLLEELQKHFLAMKEKNIELTEKMNLIFIQLLIIKYFTHLKSDMPDHLFTEGKQAGLLDWLQHFADTGLMKEIIEDVFLKDQVGKVFDKLTEFLGHSMLLEELGEKTQEHFKRLRTKHADTFEKLEGFNVKADK